MRVNQALILAGSVGTRLGMGTKSLIEYKGKLLLEYLLISCINTGIENIIVVTIPKEFESYNSKDRLKKFDVLKKNYPLIKFVPDNNKLCFREVPSSFRKHLNVKEPFFLLCGQSPQSSRFLEELSNTYETGLIVVSGYKYRCDDVIPVAELKEGNLGNFKYRRFFKPEAMNCKDNKVVHHFPYIIDYNFYDKYVKKDNFKERVEYYPYVFHKDGGTVKCLINPVEISEVDYKVDLDRLYASVDFLSDLEGLW